MAYKLKNMIDIDVTFDSTSDSPNYWDGFWERNGERGEGNCDPDSSSIMLQKYHHLLWSKKLPCGKMMTLTPKGTIGNLYLEWEGMAFTSDSIAVSHRYYKMDTILKEVKENIPNYRKYIENFIHKAYTIGGMMIWPCRRGSINQIKGFNRQIADRIDRTLECIRRFYDGEDSPMGNCLERNRDFFELFSDFRGFVDFFFFQDLVSPDYGSVKMLMGNDDMSTPALAQSAEEYRQWLDVQLDFVARRNERIKAFVETKM